MDDRLFTLSTASGLATPIDPDSLNDLGDSSVSGLAFSAVPEPASAWLLGLGGLAVAAAVRGRRPAR